MRRLIKHDRSFSSATPVDKEAVKKSKQQVEIQLQYTNGLTDMYRRMYPESAWHFSEEMDFELPAGWNLEGDELEELFYKPRDK